MKRLSAKEQAQLELLRDTVFEGQMDLFEEIAAQGVHDDLVIDTPVDLDIHQLVEGDV